jgi:serine/threonine protein kinase
LDFGIAKSADLEENTQEGRRLTRPGVAMGTPEYMAPEQASGHPADPRSDIYSVGSILYEMLTGVPPYEGENVMEVLHKKANESPRPIAEIRPQLTPDIVALVERAMARKPEDRPQNMADFAYQIHLVETAIASTPTPASVSPTSDRSGTLPAENGALPTDKPSATVVLPTGHRRLAMAIGAGIAVVGIGSLVLTLLREPEPAIVPQPEPMPLSASPDVALDTVPPDTLPPPPLEELDIEKPDDPPPDDQPGRKEPESSPAKSVKLTPKQIQALVVEAQKLSGAQNYDEAVLAFKKLLVVPSKRTIALVGLAQIAFQQKNYIEAAQQARLAVKAGGGVDARILLGDAYFKLDRFEAAKRAYTEALKLDPENRIVQQNLLLIEKRRN